MVALLFALAGLMTVGMSMGATDATAKLRKDRLTLETSTGKHVIEIEVAETGEDQAMGLMYRQTVPPNTGMLFPYDQPKELTMWMRNTYVSLDMVFIRADGIVHRVEAGTEPLSESIIASRGNVSAVLELGAGEAQRLGLKAGDLVRYQGFKIKAR